MRYCRKTLKKPNVGRVNQENAKSNRSYHWEVKMTPSSVNAFVTQKIDKK